MMRRSRASLQLPESIGSRITITDAPCLHLSTSAHTPWVPTAFRQWEDALKHLTQARPQQQRAFRSQQSARAKLLAATRQQQDNPSIYALSNPARDQREKKVQFTANGPLRSSSTLLRKAIILQKGCCLASDRFIVLCCVWDSVSGSSCC